MAMVTLKEVITLFASILIIYIFEFTDFLNGDNIVNFIFRIAHGILSIIAYLLPEFFQISHEIPEYSLKDILYGENNPDPGAWPAIGAFVIATIVVVFTMWNVWNDRF